MSTSRRLFIALWMATMSLLSSAFLHTSDSDLDEMGQLSQPDWWLSITVIALFFAAPMGLCLFALRRWGRPAFLMTLFFVAAAFGSLIAVFGSTADSMMEWLWSLAGMFLVMTTILLLGCLPALVPRPPRNAHG